MNQVVFLLMFCHAMGFLFFIFTRHYCYLELNFDLFKSIISVKTNYKMYYLCMIYLQDHTLCLLGSQNIKFIDLLLESFFKFHLTTTI